MGIELRPPRARAGRSGRPHQLPYSEHYQNCNQPMQLVNRPHVPYPTRLIRADHIRRFRRPATIDAISHRHFGHPITARYLVGGVCSAGRRQRRINSSAVAVLRRPSPQALTTLTSPPRALSMMCSNPSRLSIDSRSWTKAATSLAPVTRLRSLRARYPRGSSGGGNVPAAKGKCM